MGEASFVLLVFYFYSSLFERLRVLFYFVKGVATAQNDGRMNGDAMYQREKQELAFDVQLARLGQILLVGKEL